MIRSKRLKLRKAPWRNFFRPHGLLMVKARFECRNPSSPWALLVPAKRDLQPYNKEAIPPDDGQKAIDWSFRGIASAFAHEPN